MFKDAKFITLAGFIVAMTCSVFVPVETLPPVKTSLHFAASPSGTEILQEIVTKGDHLREGILYRHILKGHVPAFLDSFVRISFNARDGQQRMRHVEIDVAPDYLAVGRMFRYNPQRQLLLPISFRSCCRPNSSSTSSTSLHAFNSGPLHCRLAVP